ncbi:hypothetical protein FDECE_6870 [Fusarium decemcellulare]|nr:hypothetical protein FDECE_6870 [Fusarium decemcellulare]
MDLSPFSSMAPSSIDWFPEETTDIPMLNESVFRYVTSIPDYSQHHHHHHQQHAQRQASHLGHLKRGYNTFLSGRSPDPVGSSSLSSPSEKDEIAIDIRRHVLNVHLLSQYNEQCPDCLSWFRSKGALSSHLKNGICRKNSYSSAAKVDMGISEEIAGRLRERRSSNQVVVWSDLWTTMFPGCIDVPNPDFVPVIEGPETIDILSKSLTGFDGSASQRAWDLLGGGPGDDTGRVLRELYEIVAAGQGK